MTFCVFGSSLVLILLSLLSFVLPPGFRCEEHDNPADFLLDVLNHCEGLRVPSKGLLALENSASQADTDLPLAYAQSAECRATQTKCQTLMDKVEATEKERETVFKARAKYATSFLWQVCAYVCMHISMYRISLRKCLSQINTSLESNN